MRYGLKRKRHARNVTASHRYFARMGDGLCAFPRVDLVDGEVVGVRAGVEGCAVRAGALGALGLAGEAPFVREGRDWVGGEWGGGGGGIGESEEVGSDSCEGREEGLVMSFGRRMSFDLS